MHRLKTLLAAMALGVALSACTVTFTGPFPDATRVTATTDPDTAVAFDTLSGGASVVYAVRVPAGAKPLVYFEVDRNLSMRVYGPVGSPFASSASPAFFEAGFEAASARLNNIGGQSIGHNRACRGSCVIRRARSETVYVELTNRGSGSVSYRFYAYTEDYADSNEPGNDTPAGAVSLNSSGDGAIETLGDVDYFRVTRGGLLNFNTMLGSDIGIEAEVRDISGNIIATLRDGDSTQVFDGDIIRVSSALNRAGPPSVSGYFLFYND